MRIVIGTKGSLNELKGAKRDIYEVIYKMKISNDANLQQIQTDIRAIKGVAICTPVPAAKEKYDTYELTLYRIKFVPYEIDVGRFLENLERSFRDLRKYGLGSFSRSATPRKMES